MAVVATIVGVLGGKLALLLGSGVALGLGLKLIPWFLHKQAGKFLDHLLDAKNPEDRELLKALVKWAEVKLPDAGMGGERFKLVAAALTKLVPPLRGQEEKLSQLIETAVTAVDEELKERAG